MIIKIDNHLLILYSSIVPLNWRLTGTRVICNITIAVKQVMKKEKSVHSTISNKNMSFDADCILWIKHSSERYADVGEIGRCYEILQIWY